MEAIYFTAKNELTFTKLPDPKPSAGQVVIEVKASGICHTDFEVLKANYGTGAFPLVPGHEYAGVIVDIGPEVKNVKVGDRVVVDPNIECGQCKTCQKGWAHLCTSLGAYGVTVNGGFAQYSLVNSNAVHLIGDLDFSLAALAEPMGCVLNGVGAIFDTSIQNALIFGSGPMGLLFAEALKFHGIRDITLVDKDTSRLELASGFGFQVMEVGSAKLEQLHQSQDLVVEATGVTAVAKNITYYMANGGKGLFFGVCTAEDQINIRPFELFRRQLRLAGSHSLNHNIQKTLPIIQGSNRLNRLISHQLSLEETASIFNSKPPSGSLKIQTVF